MLTSLDADDPLLTSDEAEDCELASETPREDWLLPSDPPSEEEELLLALDREDEEENELDEIAVD